jgi:hypothetical protein
MNPGLSSRLTSTKTCCQTSVRLFICQISTIRFRRSIMPFKSVMSESTMPDANHTNGDRNPHSAQLSELLFVSSTVLQQALDLVDNILTNSNQLTVHSKYLPGSTIGNHISYSRFNVNDASNRKTPTPCTGSLHSSDRLCSGKPTLRLVIRCTQPQHSHGEQPLRSSQCVGLHDITPQRARSVPLNYTRSSHHSKCRDTLFPFLRNHLWQRGEEKSAHEAVFTNSALMELWFAALHAVHHWSMVRKRSSSYSQSHVCF